MNSMKAQVVNVTIDRSADIVYDIASRPETMPLWASGLASGLEPDGDHWIASGPLGTVTIAFVPRNIFGVIDHTVTMETGLQVYNALRVTPNGSGAEVTFIVLQRPDVDDDAFAQDVAWVRKDLMQLKAFVEDGGGKPA